VFKKLLMCRDCWPWRHIGL